LKTAVDTLPLGRVGITRAARDTLSDSDVYSALARHSTGDWGELSKADLEANRFAVRKGLRVLSAYTSAGGVKFWIITEADRSSTLVLLTHEY
jgi:hypothetical protein